MALSHADAVYAKLYFLWHFGIWGSSFGGVLVMLVNPSVKFSTSKPDFEHLLIFNGWSWKDPTPLARSFTRPSLVCACNERSNGLLPVDNWYESNSPFMFPSGSSSEKGIDLTPSVLVLPFPRPDQRNSYNCHPSMACCTPNGPVVLLHRLPKLCYGSCCCNLHPTLQRHEVTWQCQQFQNSCKPSLGDIECHFHANKCQRTQLTPCPRCRRAHDDDSSCSRARVMTSDWQVSVTRVANRGINSSNWTGFNPSDFSTNDSTMGTVRTDAVSTFLAMAIRSLRTCIGASSSGVLIWWDPRKSVSSWGQFSGVINGTMLRLVVSEWPHTRQVFLMVYPVDPCFVNSRHSWHLFGKGGFGGFLLPVPRATSKSRCSTCSTRTSRKWIPSAPTTKYLSTQFNHVT